MMKWFKKWLRFRLKESENEGWKEKEVKIAHLRKIRANMTYLRGS